MYASRLRRVREGRRWPCWKLATWKPRWHGRGRALRSEKRPFRKRRAPSPWPSSTGFGRNDLSSHAGSVDKRSDRQPEYDEAAAEWKAAQAALGMAHARRTQIDAKMRNLSRRSALLIQRGSRNIIAPFSGTSLPIHDPELGGTGAPFTIERDAPSGSRLPWRSLGFRGADRKSQSR